MIEPLLSNLTLGLSREAVQEGEVAAHTYVFLSNDRWWLSHFFFQAGFHLFLSRSYGCEWCSDKCSFIPFASLIIDLLGRLSRVSQIFLMSLLSLPRRLQCLRCLLQSLDCVSVQCLRTFKFVSFSFYCANFLGDNRGGRSGRQTRIPRQNFRWIKRLKYTKSPWLYLFGNHVIKCTSMR